MKIISVLLLAVASAIALSDPSAYRQGRVVGGEDAEEGAYPYMVSLQTRINENPNQHFCGGSILNEHFVLTASHCLDPRIPFDGMTIYAGAVELSGKGVRYALEKKFLHELWDINFPLIHDIGLVKTVKPIVWTDRVKPIELYTDPLPGGVNPIIATGWGRIVGGVPGEEIEKELPDHMQVVSLTSVDWTVCKELLPEFESGFHVGQICAINGNRNRAVCNADSGGPITYKGKVLGALSWGIAGCSGEFPDNWASVPYYAEWIRTKIAVEMQESYVIVQ